MDYRALAADFQSTFFREADRFFFSPCAINLMGDYSECNSGYRLSCAISDGSYGVVRKRNDRLVRLYSKNHPEQGIITFTLEDLTDCSANDFEQNLKEILQFLISNNDSITAGFDLLIAENFPTEIGLSSSSSSKLMLATEIITSLYNLDIDSIELIKAAKMLENKRIDELIAMAYARADHALLLDCHTLHYHYVPLRLRNYKLIIIDTNKRPELEETILKNRKEECEQALAQLQTFINIMSLSDLNLEQFKNVQHFITTDILRKRAKHIISENERTIAAAEELRNGNLLTFGQLLNESHLSLRDDFETTGLEIDTLIIAAWQQRGVLGARMMGDYVFAFVEESKLDQFICRTGRMYLEKIGYKPTFYPMDIGEGVREIKVKILR